MAIIITANQIYDIVNNDKIIDNEIENIGGDENQIGDEKIDIIFSYDFVIWENKSGNNHDLSTNKSDYENKISNNTYIPEKTNLKQLTDTGIQIFGNYAYYKIQFDLNNNILSAYNNDSVYCTFRQERLVTNQYSQLEYYINSGKIYHYDDPSTHQYFMGVYDSISDFEDTFFRKNNGEIESIKNYGNNVVISCGIVFNKNISDLQQQNTACMLLIFETDSGSFYPTFNFNIKINLLDYTVSTIKHENSALNKIYNLSTNEFYQTGTTYNGKNIFSKNSKNIISEWSNGKETATLKCSIGEYYDENDNLVISTKNDDSSKDLPMLFNIGDLVIPYKPVADNKIVPMSLYKDGTPKVFKITQVRPYFDGACWQEITIQEVKK